MNMPYWIKKTISGSLICFFCGSGVLQVGGVWFCSDLHCERHVDIPAEKQQGFVGGIIPDLSIGTVSAPSVSPSQAFDEGGEE